MRLSVGPAAALAIALVIASVAVAEAYPQFQLVHDATCGGCHLSPAGGGLLNDYGRDEAGSTISRGGDGRLLHGLWDPPDWFAIGGDFRFASAGKQPPVGEGELLVFPMQADVNLRVTRGDLAVAFTAGVRGVARDEHPPVFMERLASREHYVAYTAGIGQLRVGRFYPVWGLRLPDHTSYVRRFMGFNLYEEPYAIELAHYDDATSLHLTAFTPPPIDFLGSGVRRSGGSAQLEHQLDDTLIVGAHTRAAAGDHDAIFTVGGIGKLWLADAKLLVLGELDVQRQAFWSRGAGRTQIAAYLGASRWLARGVMLASALHVWDPDLTLAATTRHAFDLTANYFPWAHVELQLLLRAMAQGRLADDAGFLSLLQIHYYL